MNKKIVIAIGGNSLIEDITKQTVEAQFESICKTAKHIVKLIGNGYNVVITHGNGPQVGFILRRSEIAEEYGNLHPVPLVSCVADTQGAIGYQIQQAISNECKRQHILNQAVTVITQVLVANNDVAFKEPTKPIGSFYTFDEAKIIRKEHPEWILVNDAKRGYRRVVASPKPQAIIEYEAIAKLLDAGYTVVAAGGGGIPIIEKEDSLLLGIDAVIDKDYTSALLASLLKADTLIISTSVDKVYLNFKEANERALHYVTIDELKEYIKAGHFAKGSMLPKIEASINFIEKGGQKAIITSPERIFDALRGLEGTHIIA